MPSFPQRLSSGIEPSLPHSKQSLEPGYTRHAAASLAQLSTRWLNQFGQAEISLTNSCPNSPLCDVRLALLLPWYQQTQQLLFTQWGILRVEGNSTLSAGIGQRHFTTAPGYFWGYNLFYDHCLKNHHQRLSVGLEHRSRAVILALNGYLPLSAERLVDDNAHKVRPARGVDLRLQYIPESQPCWRINLVGEYYWGNRVVTVEQWPQRHPVTATLGVDYTPVPLVTAGYNVKIGSGSKLSHHLQLSFTYHLGVPLAQQADPQQLAAHRSLTGGHLALVQRNFQVVLAQQRNDDLKLRLPPEQRGAPGERIEFTITLLTSRPLKELELYWRGDLLTHTAKPELNANKSSAALMLPIRPGGYSLQLTARNKCSGTVAHSNVMSLRIKAPSGGVPSKSVPTKWLPQARSTSATTDALYRKDTLREDDGNRDATASDSMRPFIPPSPLTTTPLLPAYKLNILTSYRPRMDGNSAHSSARPLDYVPACIITPALVEQAKKIYQIANKPELISELPIYKDNDQRDLAGYPTTEGTQMPNHNMLLTAIKRMNTIERKLKKEETLSQEELNEVTKIIDTTEKRFKRESD